jgi:aminoglycoside phosphotransferase (APT) family kinase protein
MITKPSLSELLEAVAATAEHVVMPTLAGTSVVEPMTSILMVLDRLQAEWPLVAYHLTADNVDIGLTLQRIAGLAPAGASVPDADIGEGPATVPELAARNAALKTALVATMDALDLPPQASDPPARHEADREVRELLSRMLQRERAAIPAVPPRVNPLSRGADALTEEQSAEMTSVLARFLTSEMPDAGDIHVTDLRRLAGGASRDAFVFDAAWRDAAGDEHREKCVMLRQPVSSVLESDESETEITGSRRLPHVEFKMIQLMERQGIPVPHMLWVDPTGTWLERPFSVARWIEGEADLSKLGAEPHLPAMLDQYVDILGRVHNLDVAAAGVDFLGGPTTETAASEQVELFARGFDRQRLEDFPAIAYTVRWLRKHCPVASRVSVIHGDFRLGNFMWDESGIVAMLDWEQCHVGDPLEEIAFMYWPLWSLGSLIPLREFVDRYQRASGIPVDDEALAFYRVFIELKMCVVILTGIRSFYATPERQLLYGATTGFELLRECQVRVIDELAGGGPTVEFGDDRR